ncbi:cellulose biosynthesis protein BcsE [Shimwellia pseudoproteus]|uniref:cellulose biosynthesis protein BcsE n=1 Tax=Shimwellia pseudoproteus TaxID=570012 RepID=UPI0018EDAD82|nr:cellulose biosynthesis protein BcsE [Shimwellia pseudoproteus]MBJ3814278.1 cellulose biosynthesis protein BcsE [Shimwellia pseudoproteus]
MRSVFSLGIRLLPDELSRIPAGGIWWINTDRQEDATSLVNTTLAQQPPDTRCALVTMDQPPDNVIASELINGPDKIFLFSMPSQIKALNAFTSDLSKNINPDHLFIILLLSGEFCENSNNDKLMTWLTITSGWAADNAASILVINPVNNLDSQTARLMGKYRALSGLADVHFLGDCHQYNVLWWCNDKSITGRQQLSISYRDGHWDMLDSEDHTPQNHSDDAQILSHIDVLDGAPALSEHWTLFQTNNALFTEARSAVAATIIFSVNQVSQVEHAARAVHTLRLQRGSALKLIVREKAACLRATDERLLLGCGANLVIPWTTPLSRCLTMIDSVKNQIFRQHVPHDFALLMNAVRPLALRGYQPWETFCKSISDLLNSPLTPFDSKGVLVAMRPAPGLRLEQALTLCRPGRTGDIMTLGQGQIFLFLSFCLISDLDKALSHIFPLPVGDIISNRTVWFEDKNIAAQLVEMRSSSLAQLNQPLPQTLGIQDAMNIHYDEQGWRRKPQPITLLSGKQQDPQA